MPFLRIVLPQPSARNWRYIGFTIRVSHFRFLFFSHRSETMRNRSRFASFSLCFAKPINGFFASFRFVSLQFFCIVSLQFLSIGFLLRFTSVFSLHKILFVSHKIVCLLKSNPPLLFLAKNCELQSWSWSRSHHLD